MPGSPRLRAVGSIRVIDGSALRTCTQSVWGGLPEDWTARYHQVGPAYFALDPAAASNPSWLRFALDRFTGQYAAKVLLMIERGRPVTLSVALEDRKLVALAYIPDRFNRAHRVVDQDAAVTFEPCTASDNGVPWADEPVTQFNGGFVFVRALCAHFLLTVEGRDPVPFALPLGKAC